MRCWQSACSPLLLGGCGDVSTFPKAAQAGSTITVLASRQATFTRENISVTITDADSNVFVYPAGDSRIRAVTNLYPDPLSSLVVDAVTAFDYHGNGIANITATCSGCP